MKILRGQIIVRYVGTKQYPYDWEIIEPIIVMLTNGASLKIPENYVTDFTSVPRILWSFIAPIGQYNLAAIIHDYLYTEHDYVRAFADREFLAWMNYFEPEHQTRNKVMFYALRIFGKPRWDKYSVK